MHRGDGWVGTRARETERERDGERKTTTTRTMMEDGVFQRRATRVNAHSTRAHERYVGM